MVGQTNLDARRKRQMVDGLLMEIRRICTECCDPDKHNTNLSLKDPRNCQCNCARIAGYRRNAEQLLPSRC